MFVGWMHADVLLRVSEIFVVGSDDGWIARALFVFAMALGRGYETARRGHSDGQQWQPIHHPESHVARPAKRHSESFFLVPITGKFL